MFWRQGGRPLTPPFARLPLSPLLRDIEHDRGRTPIDAKAHDNSGDDNDNDDDSGDGCNRRRCACDLGGDPDMQRAVLTRPNNQHEVEGRKGGR